MPEMWTIPFAKFHGLHNDFIIARSEDLPRPFVPLAQAITNRHTGIGADGFLVVLKPRDRENDARVRFFNADGSEAEMSGNGIRCVGAYLTGSEKPARPLRIETAAGLKELQLVLGQQKRAEGKWTFRVSMGPPVFHPGKIPFKVGKHPIPVVGFPLPTRRGVLSVTVTSMGNPHCSLFVGDFSSIDWRLLGREIERHSLFPNRTNIEFVRVISKREIEVRFWERGVGETVSSGTGSCAAAVAAILNGYVERSVHVRTTAGSLDVTWRAEGDVVLTGPVESIAAGIYYYSATSAE